MNSLEHLLLLSLDLGMEPDHELNGETLAYLEELTQDLPERTEPAPAFTTEASDGSG